MHRQTSKYIFLALKMHCQTSKYIFLALKCIAKHQNTYFWLLKCIAKHHIEGVGKRSVCTILHLEAIDLYAMVLSEDITLVVKAILLSMYCLNPQFSRR